jgi:hypothetical protein
MRLSTHRARLDGLRQGISEQVQLSRLLADTTGGCCASRER